MESNHSAAAPVLRVRGLSKSFGSVPVLHDVDLDVPAGEVFCIIGPSGSGKSTFLRCCNLLEVPDQGTIEVSGTPFHPRTPEAGTLRELRTRTAMVFQSFELFPHLTAERNVSLSPRIVLGLDREAATDRARRLLELVGLGKLADRYPSQLSGGQQQRVSIARALAMEPDIVLVDEPTSALDPEMVGEVLTLMRDLAQQGMTMLVVTHEMRFARDVANQIVVMDEGRIVEAGPPSEVLKSPSHATTRAFLKALEAPLDSPAAGAP